MQARTQQVPEEKSSVPQRALTSQSVSDRKRAEALLATEKRTLEMIANGARLADILENVCDTIDAQAGNIVSAVMLMDADGMRLWPAAGPRLPKGWIEVISPLTIGPCVGSCGSAASLKQRVIVSDIASKNAFSRRLDSAICGDGKLAFPEKEGSVSWPLFTMRPAISGTAA